MKFGAVGSMESTPVCNKKAYRAAYFATQGYGGAVVTLRSAVDFKVSVRFFAPGHEEHTLGELDRIWHMTVPMTYKAWLPELLAAGSIATALPAGAQPANTGGQGQDAKTSQSKQRALQKSNARQQGAVPLTLMAVVVQTREQSVRDVPSMVTALTEAQFETLGAADQRLPLLAHVRSGPSLGMNV